MYKISKILMVFLKSFCCIFFCKIGFGRHRCIWSTCIDNTFGPSMNLCHHLFTSLHFTRFWSSISSNNFSARWGKSLEGFFKFSFPQKDYKFKFCVEYLYFSFFQSLLDLGNCSWFISQLCFGIFNLPQPYLQKFFVFKIGMLWLDGIKVMLWMYRTLHNPYQ